MTQPFGRRLRCLGSVVAVALMLNLVSGVALGHRNGCHRWHSCESDTGSYVCGDLGYYTYCAYGPFAARAAPRAPITPEYARTPEVAFVGQSAYPNIVVGQSVKLRLSVQRQHGPSWSDGDVQLFVANSAEISTGLRGWDANGLLAKNTGRGFLSDTQDFDLLVQGLTAGTFRLHIALYHPKFGWFGPDGIYWDVKVNALPNATHLDAGWHSRWLTQSSYLVMTSGQVAEFWIRFTNVGTETWQRGRWGQQVNLALNGDNKLPFKLGMAADWLWDDRLATTTTAAVAPGGIGEFRFKVRAPVAAGNYQLNLRPVVDGTTWLEDEGVFWQIVVR